jgi:hypothetical protein
MSYDVVMVGGSGAQFGMALYECLGLGFVDVPRHVFLVDADKGFFNQIKALDEKFAVEVVALKNHLASPDGKYAQGQEVKAPELKMWPPYGDRAKREFNVLDIIEGSPLSRLGKMCLTEDEVTYPIHEGLYGMAKLGGVIVADREAKRIEAQVDRNAQRDPSGFPDALVKALGKDQPSQSAPIIIAGSVAGGTGAGFMAPLVQAIRRDPDCARRPIHVFAFLPWFELRGSPEGIGPSNSRMAKNAAQGIRFLQDVVNDIAASPQAQAVTCVHLVGIPDGAKKPERDSQPGAMHKAGPGPMMFYAASLLSDEMKAFTGTAAQMPSGVYALACNPAAAGTGVLSGRVKYTIPGLGQGGDAIPFEAVSTLLDVVRRALEELKNPVRYENAFGRLLDNPDSLPRTIFKALKAGRDNTAKRKTAGVELANLLKDHQARLEAQAATLSRVNAEVAGGVGLLDIEDWHHDKLADILHLETILARSVNLESLLFHAFAQNKLIVAADLIVRALVNGLGLGPGNKIAQRLTGHYKVSPANRLALPGQASGNAEPVQGTQFVSLSPQVVDKLGTTLSDSLPDSLSVPSALARARVARWLVEPARLRDDPARFPCSTELAETREGRLLLCWLGLSAGLWSVADRQLLEGSALAKAGRFDRAVAAFETKDGPTPYRSSWISYLAATPPGAPFTEDDIVAASSPQTGWFTSVRIDEGSGRSLEAFRKLTQELNNKGLWGYLQATYRVWLDEVTRKFATASNQPWFAMLKLFAGTSPYMSNEREGFNQVVWCSVGPVPLQVEGGLGDVRPSRVVDAYLPRLLEPREREAIVCALAGTAIQAREAEPVVHLAVRNAHIEFQYRSPGGSTVLLKLKAVDSDLGLNFIDALKGGAYEVTDWSGALSLGASWENNMRPLFASRARDTFGPAADGYALHLRHIVEMMNRRPDYLRGLGLDGERWARLMSLADEPAPFRPGLLNLFNGLFVI